MSVFKEPLIEDDLDNAILDAARKTNESENLMVYVIHPMKIGTVQNFIDDVEPEYYQDFAKGLMQRYEKYWNVRVVITSKKAFCIELTPIRNEQTIDEYHLPPSFAE